MKSLTCYRALAGTATVLTAVALAAAGCSGGTKQNAPSPSPSAEVTAVSSPSEAPSTAPTETATDAATPEVTATETAAADWAPEAAATVAAEWLAAQLVDGTHQETEYDGAMFTDYGLTVDTLFALAATGQLDQAGAIAEWLVEPDNLIAYIGDGEMALYPGAVGKLGLALGIEGLNVTREGAAAADQMVAALTDRLADTGRFQDLSEFGDYSTPTGQALDVVFLAQQSALGDLPADPVAFLASAQCEDGGYPSTFNDPEGCQSDPDSTTVVVQALMAAGGHEERVTSALTWLYNFQEADGSWASMGAVTPNSTGLAVSLLSQVDSEEARGAVNLGLQVLATWQLPDGAFPAAAGGSAGDARATSQAVLGLAGVDYLSLAGLVVL
ncbi:MAG: hypothetical protein LBR27_06690 [Bifidobacteriaceae bacterium]|jgi:hypothetical protein|nr:hypothetical protein [Bifidobacteriaceae bacterium]